MVVGLILLYLLVGVMIYAYIASELEVLFISPKVIYARTNFNYAGCIVCSILAFLLSPPLYILGFIGWLLTVGRKR